MTFRLTFEGGPSLLVDEDARLHFLRQARRHGDELTRVRGGYVISLAGRRPRMVALIEEGASNVLRDEVVSVDPCVP